MPKVSIVIPVYGVEKYIEKCVHALFQQTLDDIEYMFIDDCTPDRSIEIVKEVLQNYPNRQNQVIFHRMEKNCGQAKVREWGITHANGEYIANCDSDDWPEPNMYEQMYITALTNKSDAVICDYCVQKNDSRTISKAFFNGLKHDAVIDCLCSQKIPYCLWNKIIRKELFNKENIIFPSKPHGEDMALCLQIFSREDLKISYVNESLYNYRSDSNTLYHVSDESSILRKYEATVENVRIIEEHYRKSGLLNKYAQSIMYLKMASRDKLLSLINQEKYYNMWFNTFPEVNDKILFNCKIRLKHKVKFILAKYHIVHFSS